MRREAHDLVQALGGSETCRSRADDEDVNIAVHRRVSHAGDRD